MHGLEFDVRGLVAAKEKLRLLALPAAKRRRLLNTAAKRLRTVNRKRIRAQRNVDGTSYAPRRGRGKRKLLTGLGKSLQVTRVGPDAAVLGWKSSGLSRIAGEHQAGQSQTMSAARMRRLGKAADYSAPATKQQARALLKAGYRIKAGKRWKRPTLGWIVEHLKNGQAGLVLAQLEGKTKKTSWKIALPARSVLGATAGEVREVIGTVLQQTLTAPR
ncbi:phage virion morphogenesis protein [Pseudomonas sp. JAI115]|uniref:phage virion morphogenesis protein n=1 Tax=Pseudomonas sp. JAI115 TaxID=2723061 RepID=UPI00161584A4|nr:phage virion morphogenesis protein [Pseudomonas sp. JAI115]MBB6158511.1 phage virion morphogenesis protein [Pseudomonas sp. JAI115]